MKMHMILSELRAFHWRAVVLGAALTFAIEANAACSPQAAQERYPTQAGKTLKIAAPPTSPPFAYADPQDLNRMVGLEVELVSGILDCIGLKGEFVKGPFSAILPTIMSGSNDIMIGNVNYRADRAERVDFVIYMRSGQSAIVQKGNPKGIRSMDDLCGKAAYSTVGGISVELYERQNKVCEREGKPPIAYQPSVDQEAAVRQLQNGRADFVMDGSITAKMRAVSKDGRDLEIGFTVFTNIEIGLIVKKGNAELLAALESGMREMEADGRLRALLKRYELEEFLIPVEVRR